MSTGLTGWVDIDRQLLPGLKPGERVDYFEKRVRIVLRNPIDHLFKANEITGIPDSSALLILGVSLCCAIEATGKFLKGGRGRNVDRFYAFIDQYMHGDFNAKSLATIPYKTILWTHFRNGLAHGFTIRHGGFEGDKGDPYFLEKTIVGIKCLMINPLLLFQDFDQAFDRYLVDLRASLPSGSLYTDFNTVFADVFINGN